MAAIALALVSALLYAACFPPFEWPLTWIALVPLLAAADRPGAGRAALAGAVWGAATTASVVAWLLPTLTGYYERSLPVAIGVFAVVAATALAPWFALAFAALGAARERLPRAAWLALVPVAWVAAELLRTRFGLRSSWALLGAAHFESERLRQIADVFGVYGVSALVALGNVVAYEALRSVARRRGPRLQLGAPVVRVGAGFALLLSTALVYGEQRRLDPAADAGEPEIVLVQGAIEPSLRWQRSGALRTLRRYAGLTHDALDGRAAPPALVVWPENAIQTEPADAVYGPPLQQLVATLPAPLLVGAPRSEDGGRRFNAAHLLEPSGARLHYDKTRLLPFSERAAPIGVGARGALDADSYTAGRDLGLFDVGARRIGVSICFEAIYPELSRALAAQGATLLVNLSNDGWYRGRGGARQHLQQVVFRAIETGLPVARATTTGITAVIAPDGAIRASLPEGRPGALRTPIPAPRAAPTFYARVGDAVAWGCVALCGASLVGARVARRDTSGGRGPASARAPAPAAPAAPRSTP